MGMNGSMGAGSTPKMSFIQPHWKIATTTPYAAPIDNRFITTALSGTSSERNTAMSKRNDSVNTAAKNRMSRPARYSEKSTPTATCPVTNMSSPVDAVTSGRIVSRRSLTRFVVASSCGEVVGTTVHNRAPARVGSSMFDGAGGETDCTPGTAASSRLISRKGSEDDRSVPSGTSATSSSLPLEPAPKPSESRS